MCYLFKYFYFRLRYPFEFFSMMMKLGLHSNGVIGWIVCIRLDNICMGISALLVIDEMVMNICTNDDLMNKSEHAQHIT
jgi:hypothetical protein